MANYATNLFYANTECEKDLDRIEDFLSEHFSLAALCVKMNLETLSLNPNGNTHHNS